MEHAPVKAPEARPAASFLAPGTVFEGSFRAKGDIEIAGELKGDVASEGSVLLRSNLQSNITAGSVKLTGCTLIGDITASGPVTVSEDSKVTGNIAAQSLLCAGEINGDIRISGNTQMDANARVSGSVVTGTISVAASPRRSSRSLRPPRSPPTQSFTPSCTPTIRCAAPWTWTTPST